MMSFNQPSFDFWYVDMIEKHNSHCNNYVNPLQLLLVLGSAIVE